MGSADRIIKILAALVIAIFYFTNQINVTTAINFGAIAVTFVATSFMVYWSEIRQSNLGGSFEINFCRVAYCDCSKDVIF